MPLSFGIPIGILIALMGLILYFATSRKWLARFIFALGLAVTLFTLLAIVLALISPM